MPVYNVFEATSSRIRKNRTSADSAKTATGKVATKEELEMVGYARGWTARQLTARELREMESIQYRWHEFFNRANLEAALQAPEKPQQNAPEKTPTGRAELKALGERRGWAAVELSMREINVMSADETLWHQTYNAANWRTAFERQEVGRQNKQHMKVWDIRRHWREGVTEEQSRRAQAAGA